MPVNPNNKHYFEISGTPTVSEPTVFKVVVSGGSTNEQWAYATKTETTVYTAFNTAIDIAVDTVLPLGSTGVNIKFTRTASTSYTAGDKWEFGTTAEVKLDPAIGQFDNLQTIDVGDTRHLLAISSTTGEVAQIENIDSDEPKSVSSGLSIGASTPNALLDFEKKNKELYIAKGRDVNPQFLGYSKNNGFEGPSELQLRSNPALDNLQGATNPDSDAYDMSVVLKGGGSNLSTAKCAIGITNVDTSGDVRDTVTVQNIIDSKMYEFASVTTPISIKRWYGARTSSGQCDGFAVLRVTQLDKTEYCGSIDLWKLNTDIGGNIGQQANMYQTIELKTPADELNFGQAGDFYIVPESSEYAKWHIVISRERGRMTNFDPLEDYPWLFRTDSMTTTSIQTEGKTIQASGWDDITPAFASSGVQIGKGNEMYYMQRCIYAGGGLIGFVGATQIGPVDMPDFVPVNASHYTQPRLKPRITQTTKRAPIVFAGFNVTSGTYGTSPIIAFTGQIGPGFGSHGNNNWFAASGNFSPGATGIAQREINTGTGDSVSFSDNDAGGAQGWYTETFGPFVSNDAANHRQINYRPVNWCTWTIEIADANSGRGKYKSFYHMLDYPAQGSQSALYKKFKGNTTFSIPSWITSAGNNSGEGHLNKTSNDSPNFGIIALKLPPSKSPIFGMEGRLIFSTVTAKRRRHLLSYVRPGSRKLLTFRFGTESGPPQSLASVANPTMFPNNWSANDGNIHDPDYQAMTAYSLWNDTDTANPFNTDYFGAQANSDNHKKFTAIPGSAGGGDDKHSYRPSENGNLELYSTNWYPAATEVAHIFGVKYGASEVEQRFKAQFEGTTSVANLYTASSAEFSIETPVKTGITASWSGAYATKVFYKASLIYDGYQETPLLSTPNSLFELGATGTPVENKGHTESIDVEIRIKDSYVVSERVTGVALYRAISTSDIPLTSPEGLYRFVEEIPLFQFNHNAVRGDQSFTVRDTGDAEGTYESINGVSENIFSMNVSYTVNAQQNGYHFVGNCKHPQIPDAENYLMRSQAGKFAIFDWTKDFVELPFIPTALIGFQGKIYAFSNSQTAVVNPETLFIEDVIEGVGCINSKTMLVTDSGLVWCDYRNIYLASPAIRPIGSTILNVKNDGWLNIPTDDKDSIRCGYDSKRKAFLFFFTRGTTVHRCWAYSTQKNRWDLFETPEKVMDTTLTKDGATIILLSSNKLAKFLSNTSVNKDWYWESKKLSLGNTMVDKKVRNFKIESNSRNLSNIEYKLDGDSSWKAGISLDGNFTGDTNKASKLQTSDAQKKVHWVKLKISGDNSSTGTDIKTFATSVIYKTKRPK